MVQPKFTPGPWGLETESRSADGSFLLVTDADGGYSLADCRCGSTGLADAEEAEANARLIAAAPELFGLPREARGWIQHNETTDRLRASIDAALAKAEGRDG